MKEIIAIMGTILIIYGGSFFFTEGGVEDQPVWKLPALVVGIILICASFS